LHVSLVDLPHVLPEFASLFVSWTVRQMPIRPEAVEAVEAVVDLN
jgi:hypothetical protein